jgi:hypothetical protein
MEVRINGGLDGRQISLVRARGGIDVMAGRCVGRLDLKMNTREDPRPIFRRCAIGPRIYRLASVASRYISHRPSGRLRLRMTTPLE